MKIKRVSLTFGIQCKNGMRKSIDGPSIFDVQNRLQGRYAIS